MINTESFTFYIYILDKSNSNSNTLHLTKYWNQPIKYRPSFNCRMCLNPRIPWRITQDITSVSSGVTTALERGTKLQGHWTQLVSFNHFKKKPSKCFWIVDSFCGHTVIFIGFLLWKSFKEFQRPMEAIGSVLSQYFNVFYCCVFLQRKKKMSKKLFLMKNLKTENKIVEIYYINCYSPTHVCHCI